MEAWLVVWLVVGLVTTGMLLVMLGFLVRHTILLGRTAGKMQDELRPIADDLAAASARAADKAAHLSDRASPSQRSRRQRPQPQGAQPQEAQPQEAQPQEAQPRTPARGRGPR